MKKLKNSAEILHQQPALRQVIAHAKQLELLQPILQSCLSAAAASYCHLANYSNGRLVIIVDNAHWLTRLRYQQQQLIDRLRAHSQFAGLQRIQFRVRPTTVAQDGRQPQDRATISSAAKDCINSCAEVIEDEKLRAALLRLAQNQG